MPKLNSRSKGIRGERAVIDWLQPVCLEVHAALNTSALGLSAFGAFAKVPLPCLQRNTLQSDKGGSDIAGLPWLAAEVKNCETDSPGQIETWWAQCVRQASPSQTPVLFYKRAHRPFRVRLLGGIGSQEPWLACVVDVDAATFETWFRARLALELEKQARQTARNP